MTARCLEPQFRGPSGARRAHASAEPGDGGGGGDGQADGCQRVVRGYQWFVTDVTVIRATIKRPNIYYVHQIVSAEYNSAKRPSRLEHRPHARRHHQPNCFSRPPIRGDICHITGGSNLSIASTTRGHCQRSTAQRFSCGCEMRVRGATSIRRRASAKARRSAGTVDMR